MPQNRLIFPQPNPATPNHAPKIPRKLPVGRIRLLPEKIAARRDPRDRRPPVSLVDRRPPVGVRPSAWCVPMALLPKRSPSCREMRILTMASRSRSAGAETRRRFTAFWNCLHPRRQHPELVPARLTTRLVSACGQKWTARCRADGPQRCQETARNHGR